MTQCNISPISSLKHGTKRTFLEFSNEVNISTLSTSPLKKQKQMQKHITAIKNIKQPFTIEKLQINKSNSISIANDSLFNKQLCTKQSQYIRWVIACKFIIATSLQFDSYNCHGMHRNKIPTNMYFYIDNQKNLCALIYNTTENNSISKNIIKHCNKIETSLIQTYYGMNDINLENYFENIFENGYENEKENEDDDLWIDNGIKCTKNNSKKSDINNNIIIHIIRIPQIYYSINFDLSFYWLCCRISKFIFNIKKDFSHPLFQLFFKTIANFDCFMLSVPFIPLKGNLYQMFCQYAIGNYNHNVKFMINNKEFKLFLGTYDCWIEIIHKYKCRKSMHKYWNNVTKTDVNIMNIVIEYANLNKMNDDMIIKYINQFEENNKIKYNKYFQELEAQIPSLEQSIVDF